MSTAELKLYLLLLVSAVRIDREERIGWDVLKRGLGESLTAETVERLAEALSRYGLARMRVAYPSGASGREGRSFTPVVYFTVFGLKRSGGATSQGPRSRDEQTDE